MARLPARKDRSRRCHPRSLGPPARDRRAREYGRYAAIARPSAMRSVRCRMKWSCSSRRCNHHARGAGDDSAILGLARRIDALAANVRRPHALHGIRADLDQLRAVVAPLRSGTPTTDLGDRYAELAEQVNAALAKLPDAARIDALGEEVFALRRALEDDERQAKLVEVWLAGVSNALSMSLTPVPRRRGPTPAPTVDLSGIETARQPDQDHGPGRRCSAGADNREVKARLQAMAAASPISSAAPTAFHVLRCGHQWPRPDGLADAVATVPARPPAVSTVPTRRATSAAAGRHRQQHQAPGAGPGRAESRLLRWRAVSARWRPTSMAF